MSLFDTHCHVVEGVFGDAAEVDATLERARAAGVSRFLVIGSGYGADSAAPALAVASRHADVWASVGLHPHDARFLAEGPGEVPREGLAARLARACRHPRVVAVGEAGLDYFYDQSPRAEQREALRVQARLALARDLPLIVHDRDAGDEVVEILEQEGAFEGAGVLWHCFTGDLRVMRRVLDAGAHLSLSGIVTFKSAAALREVAAAAPLERLLIETDSPWLAPTPHRGKRNEPALLPAIAAEVARLRGMATAELVQSTTENALRLLRLPA